MREVVVLDAARGKVRAVSVVRAVQAAVVAEQMVRAMV
jgi:hypothetical protein